ncbi:MAG: hypothetical protein RL745_101 [Actinomycetota bacterium]
MSLRSRVAAAERTSITRTALSIGFAVGAYGLSFGALAVTQGKLNIAQAVVLSAVLFSGASQFAVISIVGAGGSPGAAIAASAMLGVRNGLYGLRLSSLVHPRGWRRFTYAHLTIDESTALAIANSDDAKPDRDRSAFAFWAGGISVFVLWNLATIIGAFAASRIGDPRQFGLDAAIPAGFAGLVAPRLKTKSDWLLAAVSAVIAVGVSPFVRPGVPVLIVAAVALLVALRRPVASSASNINSAPSSAPAATVDGESRSQ